MKTQKEIVTRIENARKNDPFGFECSEYIGALDFEHAKPFLKPEITESEWEMPYKTDEDVQNKMIDYMPFAWEKANDFRGISAGRSIWHYAAWLWLLGEDGLAESIRNYEYYGKPQLRQICEYLKIDADQLDDDVRLNEEP